MSLELAAAAVALIAPYLSEAGKEAAKTVGKETAGAGIALLGWLREKLTGRSKEALVALEKKPDSEINRLDMQAQLARLLEERPELAAELRALLSEARGENRGSMSQNISAGGRAIQQRGKGNTASIR